MENENNIRFAMLFSGGKDSVMALGKMIKAGHAPVCIVVAKQLIGLSHMHLLRKSILNRYSESLGLPLIEVFMEHKYDLEIWDKTVKKLIADFQIDALCSGDIAFEYSRDNLRTIAENNGIELYTPLWGIDEDSIARELKKYKIVIKSLSPQYGIDELVGKFLDEETIKILHDKGMELKDDTSEIHTIAVDGPIFSQPIKYELKKIIKNDKIVMVDII